MGSAQFSVPLRGVYFVQLFQDTTSFSFLIHLHVKVTFSGDDPRRTESPQQEPPAPFESHHCRLHLRLLF
jgi:hypothetical protein